MAARKLVGNCDQSVEANPLRRSERVVRLAAIRSIRYCRHQLSMGVPRAPNETGVHLNEHARDHSSHGERRKSESDKQAVRRPPQGVPKPADPSMNEPNSHAKSR